MDSQIATAQSPHQAEIPDRIFFRIGDVADIVGVKPYVLRYWESEFATISPTKSNTGQRVYKKTDVEALLTIKHLLYNERYSIEGARKRLKELKRDREFDSFKKEKVLARTDVGIKKERLKEIKRLAQEIQTLTKKPIQNFYRY